MQTVHALLDCKAKVVVAPSLFSTKFAQLLKLARVSGHVPAILKGVNELPTNQEKIIALRDRLGCLPLHSCLSYYWNLICRKASSEGPRLLGRTDGERDRSGREGAQSKAGSGRDRSVPDHQLCAEEGCGQQQWKWWWQCQRGPHLCCNGVEQ